MCFALLLSSVQSITTIKIGVNVDSSHQRYLSLSLFFEVEFKGFESTQHFLGLPAIVFLIEKNIKKIFPLLIASLK